MNKKQKKFQIGNVVSVTCIHVYLHLNILEAG